MVRIDSAISSCLAAKRTTACCPNRRCQTKRQRWSSGAERGEALGVADGWGRETNGTAERAAGRRLVVVGKMAMEEALGGSQPMEAAMVEERLLAAGRVLLSTRQMRRGGGWVEMQQGDAVRWRWLGRGWPVAAGEDGGGCGSGGSGC